MANQVVLLVLGFVLTTVVGGVLGYYFQRRTWDANRRESERSAAAKVFDDISRVMDERLYRMRLLYWGLRSGDTNRIAAAMAEYRATLVKWNDNLNRNLALAQRYFGDEVWTYLSGVLYEEFAIIGRHLEDWFHRREDRERGSAEEARLFLSGRRLQALGNDIFELNRFMIAMIQQGEVGLSISRRGRTRAGDHGEPLSRLARRAPRSPIGSASSYASAAVRSTSTGGSGRPLGLRRLRSRTQAD